jgi:hypothetical protein
MSLYDKFTQHFPIGQPRFQVSLLLYKPFLYVGMAEENVAVLAIESTQPEVSKRILKTQSLTLEINQSVEITENDQVRRAVVNLISCRFHNRKELKVFWDLCEIFINDVNFQTVSWTITIFQTLQELFSSRDMHTEMELQGLYAELFTILKYKDYINLGDYWHTEDKMKYDFSLSETKKIEVKSAIGEIRKHHFKHNQLFNDQQEIFVLSYLLRKDDQGLSLISLIEESYRFLLNNSKQLTRLQKIIFDVDNDILNSIKFSAAYTSQECKVFNAKDIPQFSESTPSGVANAEYDCFLTLVPEVDSAEFNQMLVDINQALRPITSFQV